MAAVVKPQAFVTMTAHAISHRNSIVHGLLLGSVSGDVVSVEDAVPLSHSAPTKPLVEIALGLISSKTTLQVVGWYTSPSLYKDKHPGPVAVRMASSLATGPIEHPVLCVVENEALGKCVSSAGEASGVVKAYGKDFGEQWLEPLKLTVEDSTKAGKATREAAEQNVAVPDFVDHLDAEPNSTWYPNPEIESVLRKC